MRSFSTKAGRYLRVWWLALSATRLMATRPLPEVVRSWGSAELRPEGRRAPQWSRTVDQILKVGPWRPRCIIRAMVLYRVLSQEGYDPALVIGIGESPVSKDAHAWVEVDGHDLGPWPGSGGMPRIATFDRNGTR